ncbi:MAG: V-type ATP synthase subunit A [Caldilineales bacterium]|nr:V-type ATP synthase subunit A [Caldilineales bacterium]MDW8317071.1 V-type ATP synthase subunit A [Anaerolineae bacterium]
MAEVGSVVRVAGPVVVAEGLPRARLYDVVYVGPLQLIGEVIRLQGDLVTVQVYENTSGLQVGDPLVESGAPLEVELGPGLLGSIFDGVQRPLPAMACSAADPFGQPFVRRGGQTALPALDRQRVWEFEPKVQPGQAVAAGDVLGVVMETAHLAHRVLVPPRRAGTVTQVRAGRVTVEEPVVWLDGEPLTLLQRWPVRQRRPFVRKLDPTEPLITGQRAIDMLFPLARGGSAIIPGGFGTGKTVAQQTIAKWADADIIVYIGCGERGNELTDVLEEFPALVDPRTNQPLMQRTILIANTSNMPVAAREASIYTGITIAEYYRDQGYHVALMADSTSRWGEALREVSGRLEEMPGEEGFPAYLPTRLAEFYERAGRVECLGSDDRIGSVSIIGAVSPPGGDFSEPITQHSLRIAGTFWALDTDLARRRHFPAIHWTRSYTLYRLGGWFNRQVAADWEDHREWALALLQRETDLLEIVQLVGADALAPAERAILLTGRLVREDFLQQSAFDDVDAFCPLSKQYHMLAVIRHFHEVVNRALRRGASIEQIAGLRCLAQIARMRLWDPAEAAAQAQALRAAIEEEVSHL